MGAPSYAHIEWVVLGFQHNHNALGHSGLQVFRTYNASITLDRLLTELEKSSKSVIVEEKKADYDKANKEVAILCNHQRSVPKTHGNQVCYLIMHG